MLNAVVFDLDDTLYDYRNCNNIAEKRLIKCVSDEFNCSMEEAHNLYVHARQNVKERLGDRVASSHNRLLYLQDLCEQANRNPLLYAMRFYNVYWDSMLSMMRPYDYVIPLFKELNEREMLIGILTDLTVHIQFRKIERLGIADYINAFVTSEEIGEDKPSSKMFLGICKKLNVLPERVLMIGDDDYKDVCGAKNAGMEALKFDGESGFVKKARSFLG